MVWLPISQRAMVWPLMAKAIAKAICQAQRDKGTEYDKNI